MKKIIIRSYTLFCLFVLSLILIACNPESKLTHVDIFNEMILPSVVSENFIFPNVNEKNVTVRWESSNPDIVSNTGEIKQSWVDQRVKITLHVTLDNKTESIDYYVIVKKLDLTHENIFKFVKLPQAVYEDVVLPESSLVNVTYQWISKTPMIISNQGHIIQDNVNQEAILKLQVTIDGKTETKDYTITVLPYEFGAYLLEQLNKIVIPDTVLEDLVLPLLEDKDIIVSWTSSNESVISNDGKVTRQNIDQYVEFTVTLNLNGIKVNKSFTILVEAIKGVKTLDYMKSINEFEKETFEMSGLPSKGTFNVLVVPVELKDKKFPSNYLTNLNKVFNGTEADTGWESVKSFYEESSYGQLKLTFDIEEKYTTKNNSTEYIRTASSNDEVDQAIISEALPNLDERIDFSKYDFNQDNHIDSVIFIYSMEVGITDDTPWWAWVYIGSAGEAKNLKPLDGKTFDYYMWASYYFMDENLNDETTLNAETYIHELGHLMGFPDLYPYEGNNDYGPLGGWDMMDNNSADHGPANKLLYGWLKPIMIDKAGTYDFNLESYSVNATGENHVLLIPYKSSNLGDKDAFDEYLLIMFYTFDGLYKGHSQRSTSLASSGIVIYKVDARMTKRPSYWDDTFINNNEGSTNLFIEILEVDKNNSMPGNRPISKNDVLLEGIIDLSSYKWNQGGQIMISIEVLQNITNQSTHADIRVTIS